MSDWLAATFLVAGSLFIVIAGLGVLRLPDTLCRVHALSKVLPVGLTLILLPLLGAIGGLGTGIKVLMILIFHLVTIPLAAHIFALYTCKAQLRKPKS